MGKLRILIVAAVISSGLFTATSAVRAQGSTKRKVLRTVASVYPPIAQRNRIGGVVKLKVIVRPNGTVESISVLGGSPALVQASLDAVRQWKFERAPAETAESVQLTYNP
jgi:TonB family protein